VIDSQFSRNGAKGLPIETHQDGSLAQIIGVAIGIWRGRVLSSAGLAQKPLAARRVLPGLDLIRGLLAIGAVGHM
jgi:hypothetical protein